MSIWSWWKRACGALLMCATAAVVLPAQTFKSLHSFDGYSVDGAFPYAGLVQGTDGNFYGTTSAGGQSPFCVNVDGVVDGCGTIFKITATGTLSTLYSFCPQEGCLDGYSPFGPLTQAADGNFYGTTVYGGANGYGTVFRITPGGVLTTLYSFDFTDGSYPGGGLVQAPDGSLYGTTARGGAYSSCYGGLGCGTIFKITPLGALTTLHSFNFTDGLDPNSTSALVIGTDGSFYGTTEAGGTSGACGDVGCGTVFKIAPKGTLTVLHSFEYSDGSGPGAGLIQSADGNFYGTTSEGGPGEGTVFKITPEGVLTTVYSFICTQVACPDGVLPSGITQASDGSFYGEAQQGGANNTCEGVGCGTVFKLTAEGDLTTIHSFDGPDGDLPYGGLLQSTNGRLYGATIYGGANCCGTIFSLSVGFGPFVEAEPAFGKVGGVVRILGTYLTGAASVTFNGTPAAFTVRSRTFITATVPAGATTGTVQVVTATGTLSSNVRFQVLP